MAGLEFVAQPLPSARKPTVSDSTIQISYQQGTVLYVLKSTEGGWIMIFEPEKIAPHGSLGGSIPRIGVYKGKLRALDALVASESPQLTF